MIKEDDDYIKRKKSEIKEIERDLSNYIEKKKKDAFIKGRVEYFMKKLKDIINTNDGVQLHFIEYELADVEQSFSYLLSTQYDMHINDIDDEGFNRSINESIMSLAERKNIYSINIDILIASLEKMRPKKKKGK